MTKRARFWWTLLWILEAPGRAREFCRRRYLAETLGPVYAREDQEIMGALR